MSTNREFEIQFEDEYPLTIDYNLSTEKCIAAGHYDWVDPLAYRITRYDDPKVFPEFQGKQTLIAYLCKLVFKKGIVSVNWSYGIRAIREQFTFASERKYKEPLVQEALAFGAMYPDIQRKFPIYPLLVGISWTHESRYDMYLTENHERQRVLELVSRLSLQGNFRYLFTQRQKQ